MLLRLQYLTDLQTKEEKKEQNQKHSELLLLIHD
jgi:hypothetical protein